MAEGQVDDDGLRGPVGEQVGTALRLAGGARGFVVGYPSWVSNWVDQQWHDRNLVVRWDDFGDNGPTTGYRFVGMRLTTEPLGRWAAVPAPDDAGLGGSPILLTPRPATRRSAWADDPQLGADLWAFAARLAPVTITTAEDVEPWLALHARTDGVVWHLRASRLDPERMVEAIDLLERVAGYAEANDAALSARLGSSSGSARWWRRGRT